MRRFVEAMGLESAGFIGNSMGASNLVYIAAELPSLLPIRSIVLASGGGFMPLTPERQTLLAYDGTAAAMRALVKAMMHDPKWAEESRHAAIAPISSAPTASTISSSAF